MKQFKTYNGYMRVKLSVDCRRGMYLVHRIVAETYLDNPNNYPIVNHKNNMRSDNNVDNLEWATNSMNQLQRYKDGRHRGTKCKPVLQIDRYTGESIKQFDSPLFAEQELGICRQNICKVCNGSRNHAGGYFWKYV